MFQAAICRQINPIDTPFTKLFCDLVVGYGLADHTLTPLVY